MSFSDRSRLRWGPTSWPRAALLTMVLLGIFGMHGLSTHCSPSASDANEMPVASQGSHHTHDAGSSVTGDPNPASGTHLLGPSDQSPDHGMGMVGICITALTGLVLALAIAFGRKYRTRWRLSRHAWLRRQALRSRIPRPPTLAELSLIRC